MASFEYDCIDAKNKLSEEPFKIAVYIGKHAWLIETKMIEKLSTWRNLIDLQVLGFKLWIMKE